MQSALAEVVERGRLGMDYSAKNARRKQRNDASRKLNELRKDIGERRALWAMLLQHEIRKMHRRGEAITPELAGWLEEAK